MKPREIKILISAVIMAGLIMTYGCGSSSSSSSDSVSAGSGNTDGVTITNEVSSPAEMKVGDIMMAEFSSYNTAAFDFSGVDSNSKYYLVVGSLDYGSGSRSVRIDNEAAAIGKGGSQAEVVYENWNSWTTEDAFDQRLHDVGYALALDPEVEMAGPRHYSTGIKAAGVDFAVSVGDTEQFRVLNSLSNMSNYATVDAKVKCVADNVVMYLDTEVESTNPEDLTDADIQELCDMFNDQVATERSAFGDESDVNGDGKVAALLTPQVNRLGAMGGGIITGFFLASDLFSRSSSNSISNEREIVYALVPDSDGHYGTTLPKAFTIDNLLTAVLAHEMQHVISYNQHVFNGEGSPESNWLNEGLSHFTEDMVGYGQENSSRVAVYFDSTSTYQLAGSGSPGLGERGASYLFMRYMYEQHSNPAQFLWNLYHSNSSGVANLETAFGGTAANFDQFGEFFMRWMAAVAMTNRGISSDARYVFQPRTYNSSTDRWQGVCTVCDADDGRGTVLDGPYMTDYSGSAYFGVYNSAARFYDVPTAPSTMTFSSASTSGTFGAVLIRRE